MTKLYITWHSVMPDDDSNAPTAGYARSNAGTVKTWGDVKIRCGKRSTKPEHTCAGPEPKEECHACNPDPNGLDE